MPEKNYIGGGAKEINTQYGTIFNLSIKVEDLIKIQNEKGYANITITKRKEVGKYGDTHTMSENTWKPEKQDQVAEAPADGGPETW